jgi:hypothetical protein
LEHEGLAFNLLDTPGHQDFSPMGFQPNGISAQWDFSPMGFQRGHLPHIACRW